VGRALVIGWVAFVGYYVLRVTVWAVPDTCPNTVWESTDDTRCDWSSADVAWIVSLPILGLLTLVALMVVLARRIKLKRVP